LLFLAVLIVPVALLTETTIESVQTLTAHIKDGTLSVPPPPESVANWPLVGGPAFHTWTMASTNLTGLLKSFAPQIKAIVPGLLSATAGLGLTVLQFVLSILLAGVLLAKASACVKVSRSLANRLFGDQGPEYEDLVASTIRSVTNGILGVAFIQAVLAGIGFLVGGLPGAGLWTLMFLVAAVLQVGALVLIPAVVYMFAIAGTTKAVLFLLWCAFVGLIRQRAEAHAAGTRRIRSYRCGVSGGDRWIFCHGYHRSFCWRHSSVRWLQALSCLAAGS
jgi:predicted PurR-regulated permease PerM